LRSGRSASVVGPGPAATVFGLPSGSGRLVAQLHVARQRAQADVDASAKWAVIRRITSETTGRPRADRVSTGGQARGTVRRAVSRGSVSPRSACQVAVPPVRATWSIDDDRDARSTTEAGVSSALAPTTPNRPKRNACFAWKAKVARWAAGPSGLWTRVEQDAHASRARRLRSDGRRWRGRRCAAVADPEQQPRHERR
jgi:hypothetical protein